ncbi:MAG: PRC-barrel domain-containing protein [Hyphomicrobiaceae bacterium]|jgi:hypothetical protein
MRYITALLTLVLVLGIAAVTHQDTALAQTATEAKTPAPVTTVPALKAKDLEGLDAFGSDGQQVGKVVKVNVLTDGNVKDAQIRSSGFFGFFSSEYVVPADKLSVKGGRVAISMTSEEVKKLTK